MPTENAAAAAEPAVPLPAASFAPRGMYEVEEFPRTPWRRRLWAIGLGLATAFVVMGSVLSPPGASKTKRLPPPDAARCVPGQDTGCVGGTATVIVAPVAPAGTAAQAAPAPPASPAGAGPAAANAAANPR